MPTLSEKWKAALGLKPADQATADATTERRAREIIEKIPLAVALAIANEKHQCEVGTFISGELPHGKGEFYPQRSELNGAAVLIYNYCEREGLHLFVGGDLKLSGSYKAPFEIIIRLSR